MKKELVLEPSTHTHVMKGVINSQEIEPGVLKIHAEKGALVLHGEHGTITTESENVIKYVQMEANPVTKKMRQVWD